MNSAMTILLGNLDDSSRKAGYYNAKLNKCKYNTASWKEYEAEQSKYRMYSLHLIDVIRDVATGKVDPQAALTADYDHREVNKIHS